MCQIDFTFAPPSRLFIQGTCPSRILQMYMMVYRSLRLSCEYFSRFKKYNSLAMCFMNVFHLANTSVKSVINACNAAPNSMFDEIFITRFSVYF